MSELWEEVRRELSQTREHFANAVTPMGITLTVPDGSAAAAVIAALLDGDGHSTSVRLTCTGRKGERSHETGERVRLERTAVGVDLAIQQPSRITADAHVERWTLDCPECGRANMWRNPTDLAHDVLRGIAEWQHRASDARDRGRCRVSWERH